MQLKRPLIEATTTTTICVLIKSFPCHLKFIFHLLSLFVEFSQFLTYTIYLFYCSTPAGYINICYYYYFVDLIWKGWWFISYIILLLCWILKYVQRHWGLICLLTNIFQQLILYCWNWKQLISKYIKCTYSIKFHSILCYYIICIQFLFSDTWECHWRSLFLTPFYNRWGTLTQRLLRSILKSCRLTGFSERRFSLIFLLKSYKICH